jgi:hypothetical protein
MVLVPARVAGRLPDGPTVRACVKGRVASVKFGRSISGPGRGWLSVFTLTQPCRNRTAMLSCVAPGAGPSARRPPSSASPTPVRPVRRGPPFPRPAGAPSSTRGASECDIQDVFGPAFRSRYSCRESNRRIRLAFGHHGRRTCRMYSRGEYRRGAAPGVRLCLADGGGVAGVAAAVTATSCIMPPRAITKHGPSALVARFSVRTAANPP